MRIFILLLSLISFSAHAWGPLEARSLGKAQGMDWHWVMKTAKAQETLELDCQSFIHNFHHNKEGKRVMSIMLEPHECEGLGKSLRRCFPFPGKACFKGPGTPTVSCGRCR
jgi:hypothetical protein